MELTESVQKSHNKIKERLGKDFFILVDEISPISLVVDRRGYDRRR